MYKRQMLGIGGSQIAEIENAMDEKKMARIEGIIYSMTPQERANPSILNPSRKRRVAKDVYKRQHRV